MYFYQTIENKDITPQSLIPEQEPWLYGCDECQTACPYNRFSKPTPIDDFKTRSNYELDYFLNLDEEKFLKEFEGSPIRRIGYEKFMQNLVLLIARIGSKKQKTRASEICKEQPLSNTITSFTLNTPQRLIVNSFLSTFYLIFQRSKMLYVCCHLKAVREVPIFLSCRSRVP